VYFLFFVNPGVFAQYWQQRVEYQMEIDFDDHLHQFNGIQNLVLYNNSPDTLYKVFYHLYYNAFQPGSMMDIRSASIPDADARVKGQIAGLKPEECGFQEILSLKQDDVILSYHVEGTILEVVLGKPVLPGKSTNLVMEFFSQVPKMIRRTGRENPEGVAYTMTQWYPKLCEYDQRGWHSHPYIGGEFYGVWGDFDVKITMPEKYIVGATGILGNSTNKRKGNNVPKMETGNKRTWHYIAKDVHDFAWAADPGFKQERKTTDDGTVINYLYLEGEHTSQTWPKLHRIINSALLYLNENYGKYPYPEYSFIQAGDGGMEYPMVCMIMGEGTMNGLISVAMHEFIHSWFYGVIANNETLHPWMDEGFTTFVTEEVVNFLKTERLISGLPPEDFPHLQSLLSYLNHYKKGKEDPLSTPADQFNSRRAYSVGAYSKGALFLQQLSYIVGDRAFRSGIKKYFEEWKFKHPQPGDFIRVFEKDSGLELDWYSDYWINTIWAIDYRIDTLISIQENKSMVKLSRPGEMPMPLDIQVVLKDGERLNYNIPLRMMRGKKAAETWQADLKVLPDWPWTHPEYQFELHVPVSKILSVVIDPSLRMADVNLGNNVYKSALMKYQ